MTAKHLNIAQERPQASGGKHCMHCLHHVGRVDLVVVWGVHILHIHVCVCVCVCVCMRVCVCV